MELFLAALVVVGICVLCFGVNIFFRKKEFPKYDVGSNEQMRKLGIRCFKDEDAALHGKSCPGKEEDAACSECNFYKLEK